MPTGTRPTPLAVEFIELVTPPPTVPATLVPAVIAAELELPLVGARYVLAVSCANAGTSEWLVSRETSTRDKSHNSYGFAYSRSASAA